MGIRAAPRNGSDGGNCRGRRFCLLSGRGFSGSPDQSDEPANLPAHIAIGSNVRNERYGPFGFYIPRPFPAVETSGRVSPVPGSGSFPGLVHRHLRNAVARRRPVLRLSRPLWHESLSHRRPVLLPDMGLRIKRHFRRTLEAEDTQPRRPRRTLLRGLAASPEEWAMFAFCRKTLARSTKHRLFLATWASAGISAGIFVALSVRNGRIEWAPDGIRVFPF